MGIQDPGLNVEGQGLGGRGGWGLDCTTLVVEGFVGWGSGEGGSDRTDTQCESDEQGDDLWLETDGCWRKHLRKKD